MGWALGTATAAAALAAVASVTDQVALWSSLVGVWWSRVARPCSCAEAQAQSSSPVQPWSWLAQALVSLVPAWGRGLVQVSVAALVPAWGKHLL